jgi:hypothetical protein
MAMRSCAELPRSWASWVAFEITTGGMACGPIAISIRFSGDTHEGGWLTGEAHDHSLLRSRCRNVQQGALLLLEQFL